MSDAMKPWMVPVQYNDADQKDSSREDIPLEGDVDPVEKLPREQGDREAVKPQGGSKDTSPMRYRKAHEVKNEFGLDDEDEVEGEA